MLITFDKRDWTMHDESDNGDGVILVRKVGNAKVWALAPLAQCTCYCSECQGEGTIEVLHSASWHQPIYANETCLHCNGDGVLAMSEV